MSSRASRTSDSTCAFLSLNCAFDGVELRLRLLGLAAQSKFLKYGHAQRGCGVYGAMRMRQRGADVAVVGVGLNGGETRGRSRFALVRCGRGLLDQRSEIFAIGFGLLDECVGIELVKGRVGRACQ